MPTLAAQSNIQPYSLKPINRLRIQIYFSFEANVPRMRTGNCIAFLSVLDAYTLESLIPVQCLGYLPVFV